MSATRPTARERAQRERERQRVFDRVKELERRGRSLTEMMAALDHERAVALIEAQVLLRKVRSES